jgi:DNA-binding MarR family transcriptional regulator
MSTKWLSESEQCAWRTFITAMPDLMAALEADLSPHGITMGDYEVLVFLSEAPDNHMRMCDLAAELRLSPSGLTRRLDGLVKAGWVERSSCGADRRVMYAHLTAAGRKKMEATAPDHVASVRRHFFDQIGAKGVRQLGEMFGSVQDHLHSLQPA